MNRVLEIPEESANELAVFLREHGVTESYGDPLGIVLARLDSEAVSPAVRALREVVATLRLHDRSRLSRAPERALQVACAALDALGVEKDAPVRERGPYDSQ